MGREFELKYAATLAAQQAIRDALGEGFQTIAMETTYYDTPDRRLSAVRYTLRRRMENGVAVCTVKTPADAHGRGEWECRCDRIEDAIPELCKLGAPEDLRRWTETGLIPICGARFTRLAKTVEAHGAVLELALDTGKLLGGGKEELLCEVEVELKAGTEEAAEAYAAELAGRFGLTPEKKSKFRRALALAEG